MIGAGNYADDRACAVSATGAGEFFIRAGVAHEICARMRLLGENAQAAADAVIAEVGALGGDGGVIVAAPDGSTAFAFNTPGMYRGRADSERAAGSGDLRGASDSLTLDAQLSQASNLSFLRLPKRMSPSSRARSAA